MVKEEEERVDDRLFTTWLSFTRRPSMLRSWGNARQDILRSDADRVTCLELLREYSQPYALSVLGYCLMSNHVHLIAGSLIFALPHSRTPNKRDRASRLPEGAASNEVDRSIGTPRRRPVAFFPCQRLNDGFRIGRVLLT